MYFIFQFVSDLPFIVFYSLVVSKRHKLCFHLTFLLHLNKLVDLLALSLGLFVGKT